MCTAFSKLQNLNFSKKTKEEVDEIMRQARTHWHFCCELYRMQIQHGRYFHHEHPEGATSWQDAYVKRILAYEGIIKVSGDMCPYEMTSYDSEGAGLVRK